MPEPVIELAGHTVTFDPPQHLVMLEILRPSDGLRLNILHESGYEDDGEAELLFYAPSENGRSGGERSTATPSALPPELLAFFPKIAEVDLWNLPPQYKSAADPIVDFTFDEHELYSVSLLSEWSVEVMMRGR